MTLMRTMMWAAMAIGLAAGSASAAKQNPDAASASSAATAAASPSADIAALPKPVVVTYMSNGLRLKAYLCRPKGAGPFPVYLWNHGSEADPSFDKIIAKWWLDQGFAFFKPIRSGQGGNPGPYIATVEEAIIQKEKDHQLSTAEADAQRIALHEKANEDVVNAYKWLITLGWVDKSNVIVGGGSYGGIQTLLTAEQNVKQNLGIRAFIAMSPAAESWGPMWSDKLTSVVQASQGPIYLMQAHNDYTLGPTETLGALVNAKGAPGRCNVFPVHVGGGDASDPHTAGHAGFFGDPTAWGPAVLNYLNAVGSVTTAEAPQAGLQQCSAHE